MAFIYLPTLRVNTYKIFGALLFAVESASVDYENADVWVIQHQWFNDYFSANQYAESIRQGGE